MNRISLTAYRNRILFLLPFLVAISVFIFLVIKASVSSFTFDESYTYNEYVRGGFMDILSHRRPFSNNHLLNTLLMKYSEICFGSSELALRLPNLCAFWIFFIYLYRLTRNLQPLIMIAVMVLFLTNDYFIDFFALARGYGLSIAFMTMGTWYLIRSIQQPSGRSILLFHLSALLAVLSHFTMLHFYAAGLLIHFLVYPLKGNDSRVTGTKRILLFHLIPFLLNGIILYEPVRRVVKYNNFDFGGKEGLIGNTIDSLSKTLFFHQDLGRIPAMLLSYFILFTVLLALIRLVMNLRRRGTSILTQPQSVINLLLVILLAEILLQHLLLGSTFPMWRFALYLLPVIILNAALLLNELDLKNKWLSVRVLLITIPVAGSLSFLRNGDLYGCAEWKYDMDTKDAMEIIREHAGDKRVTLGTSWLFEPTANFYRQTFRLNMDSVKHEMPVDADYYFITKKEKSSVDPERYRIVMKGRQENFLFQKIISP